MSNTSSEMTTVISCPVVENLLVEVKLQHRTLWYVRIYVLTCMYDQIMVSLEQGSVSQNSVPQGRVRQDSIPQGSMHY